MKFLVPDSIYYTCKPGEEKLPLGDYLGDLTDELADYGAGSYLTEFISAGPKNYCYKIFGTKDQQIHTVIKVKGHTLDYNTMKNVNSDEMRKMVFAFVQAKQQKEVTVVTPRIVRVDHHKVVTRLVRKVYRVVYDKRVVLDDFTTIPYGY